MWAEITDLIDSKNAVLSRQTQTEHMISSPMLQVVQVSDLNIPPCYCNPSVTMGDADAI